MSETIGIIGMGKLGSREKMCLEDAGYELIEGRRRDNKKVLASKCDALIITVKQKDLEGLSKELEGCLDGKLVISFVAGIDTARLERYFDGAHIVRAMTNLAVGVKEGISAFCAGGLCNEDDRKAVEKILSAGGDSMAIEERLMDLFTLLAGCGVGANAHWLNLMVEFGIAGGLSKEQATKIVNKTVKGTIKLQEQTIAEYGSIEAAVSSKGGMTEREIGTLKGRGFDEVVGAGLAAGLEAGRGLNTGNANLGNLKRSGGEGALKSTS